MDWLVQSFTEGIEEESLPSCDEMNILLCKDDFTGTWVLLKTYYLACEWTCFSSES
jgi:hypothetical protein